MNDHPAGPDDRDLLFISYSHRDAVWAQRFAVMLKPLVRRRRLQVWVDWTIQPGNRWYPEVEHKIEHSRVALLLVSADYLASDFIMENELPALCQYGVRLAPVLIGECMWEEEPELTQIQWLHDPGTDGSLALCGEGERDQRIRLACQRLIEITPTQAAPASNATARPTATATITAVEEVTETAATGALSQVPPLPPGYVVRDELDDLITRLVGTNAGGAIGVTAPPAGVGLQGIGGIGKTVLAISLAHDERIRRRFPEGVYWVTVGEHPDLLAAQLDLLSRVSKDASPPPRTVAEATRRLRQAIQDRQVLVIVDDVWADAAALAFRITGPAGRLLYTSRDEQVITAAAAIPYRVEALSVAAARQLAAGILDISPNTMPATADDALSTVGRIPLAVALLSAAVRGGQSWRQVSSTLDQSADVYGDHPYAATFRALHLATTALSTDEREALLELAVFPADTDIPTPAIARYWAHTRGYSPAQTRTMLDQLAAAELLQYNEFRNSVEFHDLKHDYLLLHATTPAVLHAQLLEAYRPLLSKTHGWNEIRWSQLPHDEPYLWDHLVAHLGMAGERRSLAATVTDPAFHVQRIARSGLHASETDLARAADFQPNDPRLSWWATWLARHAHLLTRGQPRHDHQLRRWNVAATIKAWLDAEPDFRSNDDLAGLASLLSQPYLRLLSGLRAPTESLVRILTGRSSAAIGVAWSPDGGKSPRLATMGQCGFGTPPPDRPPALSLATPTG